MIGTGKLKRAVADTLTENMEAAIDFLGAQADNPGRRTVSARANRIEARLFVPSRQARAAEFGTSRSNPNRPALRRDLIAHRARLLALVATGK